MKEETLDELFGSIRTDIIKLMYDKKISVEDISDELYINIEDISDYLSLRKKDYLALKLIYEIIYKKN